MFLGVFFAPFPEEETLDYVAHGPFCSSSYSSEGEGCGGGGGRLGKNTVAFVNWRYRGMRIVLNVLKSFHYDIMLSYSPGRAPAISERSMSLPCGLAQSVFGIPKHYARFWISYYTKLTTT